MDTALYFQFPASFLTPATIRLGVSAGPEENLRGSRCPVTRIFTLFPPISITSTFMSYSSRLLPHVFHLSSYSPRIKMRMNKRVRGPGVEGGGFPSLVTGAFFFTLQSSLAPP